MKYLFSICFVFISCAILYSQDLLSGMHGIKNDKGEILFEVSGYSIVVYEMKGIVENADMISLARSYGLDHILKINSDSTLRVQNKIVESLIKTPDLPLQISQKCFLLQKDDNTVTVLYLETSMKRDFVLEEEIVHACINDKLLKYVTDEGLARFMPLAGEKFLLPRGAEWVAPHKILYEDSQISWSEFSSVTKADQYLKNQIAIDKADDIKSLEADNIKVLFNEKPAKARRIVYRDPANLTLSNYLVVYYVMVQLRGTYVSCILSHYANSTDDFYLPPLLESVMQISSVSGNAKLPLEREHPFYSVQSFEAKNKYNPENNYFYSYRIEIQLGSVLPFGNLRDVYPVAPSLGFYCSIPLFYRLGLDMGFQGAIPIESGFDYYYSDGSTEHTKATGIVGINMRGRYLLHQTGDWIFSGYLGVGANWLFTNIIDEGSYDWETDSYRKFSVASLDAFAGCNISYKKIGLFVEYHLTPYGNSNKVKYDFGKNSFNLGLTFTTGWDL